MLNEDPQQLLSFESLSQNKSERYVPVTLPLTRHSEGTNLNSDSSADCRLLPKMTEKPYIQIDNELKSFM